MSRNAGIAVDPVSPEREATNYERARQQVENRRNIPPVGSRVRFAWVDGTREGVLTSIGETGHYGTVCAIACDDGRTLRIIADRVEALGVKPGKRKQVASGGA